MDTQISHTASNRGLVLLTVVGLVLLILSALLFFDIFVPFSESSASEFIFTGLNNTDLTAQIVAMLFWSILSLIGGSLWIRAFSRISGFVEITVLSLVLGGLVVVIGTLVPSLVPIAEVGMVSAYTLTALFAFTFIGFLLFLGREILMSAFSK